MTELIWKGSTFEQRDKDDFVCLTQMATIFSKKVNHWLDTNNSKAYIEAVSSETGIPVLQLLISLKGNSRNFEQGTWAHPLIAIAFAQWLSPEFQVWCNIHVKLSKSLFDFDKPSEKVKETSGFVYLVKATTTSFYKIGVSKDCYKRLQTLQTGNPLELTIIERIFSVDCIAIEKALHTYYEAYSIRGEWFDFPKSIENEFYSIANQLDKEIEARSHRVELS
jgi:hypothetical protein